MSEKIVVTGGAGYIGSHTAKALSLQGYQPIVIDNLSQGHAHNVLWGPLHKVDILDQESLQKVFEEHQPTAVMHFAAVSIVSESVREPERYEEVNVRGTRNVLEAMTKVGCDKIVFSSSCAVYGHPTVESISEDVPQDPVNPYGQTKWQAETVVEEFHVNEETRFVTLRYFNACGADPDGELSEEHEPETHLIPRLLDVAEGKLPQLEVYGTDYPTPDGTCIRDYVHVADIAGAHVRALDYLKNNKEPLTLNIGTGKGHSVFEVIRLVTKVTGKNIGMTFKEPREGDPARLTAHAKMIEEKLHWVPRFTELETAIEHAWKARHKKTS